MSSKKLRVRRAAQTKTEQKAPITTESGRGFLCRSGGARYGNRFLKDEVCMKVCNVNFDKASVDFRY